MILPLIKYKILKPVINSFGFDIRKIEGYPPDFTIEDIAIWKAVERYTLTTKERVKALINATRYIIENGIEGSFVECGVWRGGSSMAMAFTILQLGCDTRSLYLYDTFSGMTEPTDADISFQNEPAQHLLSQTKASSNKKDIWCLSPLGEVRHNLFSTNYPEDKIHFVKGKVENTLPEHAPKKIALLRLDTDWYESTKHELCQLFPLLQKNGVLIIDDYGHWKGAKKAVKEYILENNIRIFLNRIDYSCRIGIKS